MSHYERLAGLRPANKTAAIVIGAKGEAPNTEKSFGQLHTETPIGTKPRPSWAIDLIGLQCGRLTVIGFHGGSIAHGSVWVVRCVCGAYETRRSHKILKALGSEHSTACCKACVQLRAIQLRGSSMKMKKAVSVRS